MTDTHSPDSVMRADRAELILEALRLRALDEADLQASAMVMAGLKLLQDVRGTEAVLDTLRRLGPALVERGTPTPPRSAETASTPATPAHEVLVGRALAHLRGLPADQARAEAAAALSAVSTFLAEVPGGAAPVPAPVAPMLPPERLAGAVIDHLRTLNRDEAHERARGVVAGAGAYLHETFGRTYASAVLAGTLQAAAEHGDAMRGGRDTLDTLH